MPEPTDIAARVEALELMSAHQDTIIEDLNAAVTKQWLAIEALSRRVAALDDRVGEAEAQAGAQTAQTRPPHY